MSLKFFSMAVFSSALFLSLVTTGGAITDQKNPVEKGKLRDPFRYVVPKARQSSSFDQYEFEKKPPVNQKADSNHGLQGIFVTNGVYRALYDNQWVSTGDKIGGLVIKKISLYAITVEEGSVQRRIELFHDGL